MENKTEKKKLPAFVILAIIALVSALALGFTNAITEGPIEKLAQEELAASFSQVMPAAAYDTLEVPAEYKDVNSLAAAKDESGNVVGYAVKASQQGYAGPVAVILGVDPKGKVTSAQIGDASFQETNGFGARWKEEANVNRLVGLDAVDTESYLGWRGFLQSRGVEGVICVTSDAHEGLRKAIEEVFPGAAWQRCVVHLERNASSCAKNNRQKAAICAIMHAVSMLHIRQASMSTISKRAPPSASAWPSSYR